MSRVYKATGINLKSMPMGECDRLLTVLTQEYGLMRVVAMGSRKQNSHLGGRSGLFVVNQLILAKGRSLDKITQAETIESYPGLAQDIRKLTASQYLAELVLYQALSDQPQEDLFCLLQTQLKQLEQATSSEILPTLVQGIFQLLALAGIAPQLYTCCVTQQMIHPDFANSHWRSGFSITAGGVCTLAALEQLRQGEPAKPRHSVREHFASEAPKKLQTTARQPIYQPVSSPGERSRRAEQKSRSAAEQKTLNASQLNLEITAAQLALLQDLPNAERAIGENSTENSQNLLHRLPPKPSTLEWEWLALERILRQYSQYHFDRLIHSATLVDVCFMPMPPVSS
jgi:DNA repair protein RecO (recombination protein O)